MSPQAIGIDEVAVRRKRTRDSPSRRASVWACASHGAAVTSGVRRDIHCNRGQPEQHAPQDQRRAGEPQIMRSDRGQRNTPRRVRRNSSRRRVMVLRACPPGADTASGLASTSRAGARSAGNRDRRRELGRVATPSLDADERQLPARQCQRSAGTASALISPSVHTRWRTDAGERRSAAASRPAAPRITVAAPRRQPADRTAVKPHGLHSALSRRIDQARQAVELRAGEMGRRVVEQRRRSPARRIRQRRSGGCAESPSAGRCPARPSAGRRSAGRPVRGGRGPCLPESAAARGRRNRMAAPAAPSGPRRPSPGRADKGCRGSAARGG